VIIQEIVSFYENLFLSLTCQAQRLNFKHSHLRNH